MNVRRLRFALQILCFVILTYGGHFGLRLGHFLPCFACPYVGGCAGDCYLMALQGPFWGFQMSLTSLFGTAGLKALGMFTGFVALTLFLGKIWCGWVCPFGTLQDWMSALRKKLGIRESKISWAWMDRIKAIKYIVLALLSIIPIMVTVGWAHPDFRLPFCQICPAKPLMPIFAGNFTHLALDFSNPITLVMSSLSVALAGFFLAGMFFKDRFFCVFCPLLALISLFDKFGALRFRKRVNACLGCGNCQRVCPIDNRQVHDEQVNADVSRAECLGCFNCAASCPQDETLTFKWWRRRLFSSSRRQAAKTLMKGR